MKKKKLEKIFSVLNNNLKYFNKLNYKKKMDNIKEILVRQNLILLKKIADDKFTDETEKEEFIKKYNKINYKNFKIVNNENLVNDYDKILNALFTKK